MFNLGLESIQTNQYANISYTEIKNDFNILESHMQALRSLFTIRNSIKKYGVTNQLRDLVGKSLESAEIRFSSEGIWEAIKDVGRRILKFLKEVWDKIVAFFQGKKKSKTPPIPPRYSNAFKDPAFANEVTTYPIHPVDDLKKVLSYHTGSDQQMASKSKELTVIIAKNIHNGDSADIEMMQHLVEFFKSIEDDILKYKTPGSTEMSNIEAHDFYEHLRYQRDTARVLVQMSKISNIIQKLERDIKSLTSNSNTDENPETIQDRLRYSELLLKLLNQWYTTMDLTDLIIHDSGKALIDAIYDKADEYHKSRTNTETTN